MNRVRGRFDPASASQQQTATSKPNRLSRRYRQTQQTQADVSSPSSQRADFKTPTRIPRPKASGASFSGESPHNDSDFQQDIIWDATSPSPNRLCKRGKKQRAGIVDISEIVNRIAPKHGRPEVSEPTLQQWIGDSATIPCTPDVQAPKHKKKSPRPNGVDDLLKLAKQFDFNMFHQDDDDDDDDEEEEKAEEALHQQSQELLSEDILDLENGDFLPSAPGNCRPAVKAAVRTDVQIQQDQHMEDDLDFLFDGPTQHVSGDLSQVSSAQPTQVKAASGASSKEASGKPPSSSHGPTSSVSTTNTKVTLVNTEFDDDWENDDLLNDSLVLEMTQNPQNFGTPKHSSTQKLSSEIKHQSPTNSKMNFSSETAHKDTQQSRFSSGNGVSVKGGSQRTWQTSNSVKSDPQKPPFHQSSSSSAKYNTTASAASNTPATKTAPSFSAHHEAPAGSDLLDEDLESFFSSDLVWDDPADDDLLCEMCEDMENQIQSSENVSTKLTLPVGHTSNQRAAIPPASRSWDNKTQPASQQPFPPKQTPAAVPCASGSTNSSTCAQVSSRLQAAPQGNTRKDQFTFKKPNSPVSMVTNKAVAKCSASEIELKKQQAMERRRQRLQAAQNPRAPT
ncbi:Ewing's tumor-associated antigen 1 -like protein [Collichthys lucidus]|uniref:Ewing's tumor-associated antigen 1-like protein n=1 Tax=Collichthys lucidus TaxID=240159 RepID=A0A4U5U5E8_COLLU|nr:Ewing's tumor-associated antigen 1 -like protein [Collichthys lucidus]